MIESRRGFCEVEDAKGYEYVYKEVMNHENIGMLQVKTLTEGNKVYFGRHYIHDCK